MVRSLVSVLFAFCFTVMPFGIGYFVRNGFVISGPAYIAVSLILLILILPALFLNRFGFDNEANRKIVRSLFIVWFVLFMRRVSGIMIGLEPMKLLVQEIFLFVLFFGMLAATVDRRLSISAIIYFIMGCIAMMIPAWVAEIYGVANGLGCMAAAYAWSPVKPCQEGQKTDD
jgi:hypothetical protein